MSNYNQAGRLLRIETTLGANKALLIELEGTEALSRPFLFRITMETQESEDKVRALLGEAVTLWIGATGDADARPIHGHFRRISRYHGKTNDNHVWQAEVVPRLWFLSRKSDCRIFQDKTVVQVLAKIFEVHGVQFTDNRTTATYPKMKHCVQYRETALDFVSRLMEEFGICYWHEFEGTKHTLVFADSNVKAKMMVPDTVAYGGFASGQKLDWVSRDVDFRSGAFASRDFNFKTAATDMTVVEETTLTVPRMKDHQLFEFAGRYQTPTRGRDLAKLRMQAEEAQFSTVRGGGNTKAIAAGVRVDIDDHVLGAKTLHLITEVHHSARDTSLWVTTGGAESRYKNEFSAIEAAVPYRPLRVTPRPVVTGIQTGTVTGPGEVHTDQFGRVKVRFHWDRNPDGSPDANPSCWVRVSQGWAGKNWGMMHIPRVGHEVIVDFIDGDPDQPLVVGRVYNNENMPPWALPANKTQSGIKSNSSLGGGGSNEFRFEDLKGSEEIYLHAEKDLNSTVENNETRTVGGKGTGDRTTTIKHNETLWVKGPLRKTTVDVDFEEIVKGKETRTITGPIKETITNNYTMEVTAGKYDVTTSGGVNIKSPSKITVDSDTKVSIKTPTAFKWGDWAGDWTHAKFGFSELNMSFCFALKFDINVIKMDFTAVNMGFNGFKLDVLGVAVKKVKVSADFVTVGLKLQDVELKKAEVDLTKGSIKLQKMAVWLAT